MQRAIAQITVHYDEIIIDGNYNFLSKDARSRAVIKADGSVPAVSAASIVAKVARDEWMCKHAALEFPQYGFDKHVGYGTKLHRDMLKLHGVSSLHRQSYKPIQSLS
jgi:ribonuclease HII